MPLTDAPPYVDRTQETTTTTGTGTVTLAGAVLGYEAFSVKFVTNSRVYYCIKDGAGNWEVGMGIYNSATPSISRDVVFASSNADALVSFPAGTKFIFATIPGLMVADKGLVIAHAMHAVMF